MNKNIFKSIGSVFAGFVAIVLSIVTDIVLESTGIFPPPDQPFFVWWMLLLALAYRSVYGILGGYITGKLAPDKPMLHTIILATIGTVLGTLGSIANWDKVSPELHGIRFH